MIKIVDTAQRVTARHQIFIKLLNINSNLPKKERRKERNKERSENKNVFIGIRRKSYRAAETKRKQV